MTDYAGYSDYADRSLARLDLSLAAPLSRPLAIYIEPTNICNFGSQCFFCAQHRADYKEVAGYHQHIPMEIVEKTIRDIRQMGGVKSIKLHFLGEGSLHPEITQIAKLACTVSDDVLLTTNGTGLSADKAALLIFAGIQYIRVSIYEETKANTQNKILTNIRTLREMRDDIGCEFPRIVVKWLSNNPAFADWVRQTYANIADEFLFEGLRNFANAFVTIQPTPLTTNRTGSQLACALPFYQLVVKANGDVAACCAAWDQTLNVGNVMEQTLLEIWQGERLARIHRLHLEGRRKELSTCSTCDTIFQNQDSVDGLTVEEYERRKTASR